MFTGIVEGRCEILAIDAAGEGRAFLMRPVFDMPVASHGVVSHNGVALSVEPRREGCYLARSPAALNHRTTILGWEVGWFLSVERSATLQSPLDGHILRGQIDTVATVDRIWDVDSGKGYRLRLPERDMPLLIRGGTLAVDGVGLNVVDFGSVTVDVWLGQRTLELTNLGRVRERDLVNIEYDIFSKYIARRAEWLAGRFAAVQRPPEDDERSEEA